MTFSESGCKSIAYKPDLVYGFSDNFIFCHNFEPPSIPFQIPESTYSLLLTIVVNWISGELCIRIQLFPPESYILINLVYPPTSPSKLSEAVNIDFISDILISNLVREIDYRGGGYVIFLRLSRKLPTSYAKLRQYWYFLKFPTLLFTVIYKFDTVTSKLLTPLNLLQTDRSLVWVI